MNYISIMKVFIGLVDHSRGIIQGEGCGRTLDEIVEWTRMTDDEKQQVMIRLSEKPEIKIWEGGNLY